MSRQPLLLASAAFLALGLIALGWWLGQREATTAGTIGETVATPATENVAATLGDGAATATTPSGEIATSAIDAAPAAAAAITPEPLPPADTVVADVFDELLSRARRGDNRAACRLATELQRCQQAGMRPPMSGDRMETMVASESNARRRDSMIEFMAQMEEQRERSDRVCTGLTPEQIENAFPLQMQAAAARPELRVWAALNPALERRFFVNDLEQWQQYRSVARGWLEQAAAQGDVSAVVALARVHGDQRSMGPPTPPFRELDDARSLTYSLLMERYGIVIPPVQHAAEQVRDRLTPQQQAEAEQRATDLFRPESVLPQTGRQEAMRSMMRRTHDYVPDAQACE